MHVTKNNLVKIYVDVLLNLMSKVINILLGKECLELNCHFASLYIDVCICENLHVRLERPPASE